MPIQTSHPFKPAHHQSPQPTVLQEMDVVNGCVAGEMTPNLQRISEDKVQYDENDEKIINATLKAFESGSLTPLIKEELRCTIQSRRIAEGKGEMKVEFKTPVRRKEMDDDERKRAVKRRQQNREAAQRFRQKQKDTSDYLSAKIKKLEKNANALTDAMNSLKEEKELLHQMLRDHLSVCSNPNLSHSPIVSDITNQEIAETPSQPLLSASSTDSHFTYDSIKSESVTSCDTSVVSPDPEMYEDSTFTQMLQMNVDDGTENISVNNVILCNGQWNGCYEEIIIDFSDTQSDMQNASRTRGDSCSSVDTVASCNRVSTPELTPLTEVSADLFNHDLSLGFQVNSINCGAPEPFDKSAPPMTNDYFLIENVYES